MEKKSYVEKMYKGLFKCEIVVSAVEDRDPLKIENEDKMEGFRFFDQEVYRKGLRKRYGEKSNYSSWIFFGKKFSLIDMIEESVKDPSLEKVINRMIKNHYRCVCLTQNGTYLPMEENDITYTDYLMKNVDDIKILKLK